MKYIGIILLSFFLCGFTNLSVKPGDILEYKDDICSDREYDGCKLKVDVAGMMGIFEIFKTSERTIVCGSTFECHSEEDEKSWVCFDLRAFKKVGE